MLIRPCCRGLYEIKVMRADQRPSLQLSCMAGSGHCLEAGIVIMQPHADLPELKVSCCHNRWWISRVAEHQIQVVSALLNDNGCDSGRDVVKDSTCNSG